MASTTGPFTRIDAPSAIQNTGSLSVDNLDIEGMLSAGSITEDDILAFEDALVDNARSRSVCKVF